MKKHLMLIFSPFLILLLAGCSSNTQSAVNEIGYGEVKDSVYHNEYLGLTVPLPPDWHVQSQETNRQLAKMGGDIIGGDDENMQAVVKASELTSVNLLSVFKHPLGAPVEYNPSVICTAEKISSAPGIKNGQDYLFHAKNVLENGALQIAFPEPITTDSRGFGVMPVEMTIMGMTIQQNYYAIVTKGYAVSFVLSYISEEDQAAVQKIFDSMEIK